MRVSAQNDRRMLAAEPPADFGLRRQPHVAVLLHGLQEIGGVAAGRTVAEEDVFDRRGLFQGREPGVMVVLQFREGRGVRPAHLFPRLFQKPAVVIAADGGPGKAHQHIGRLRCFQRPGDAIAEIDDGVRRDLLDVVHHGAQGAHVAMNVGDHRDAHQAACSLA